VTVTPGSAEVSAGVQQALTPQQASADPVAWDACVSVRGLVARTMAERGVGHGVRGGDLDVHEPCRLKAFAVLGE
jgi:hypothetical protein